MSDGVFRIEVDGREYLLPNDLDLNDSVELEEQFEDRGSMKAIRFMVWRVLIREHPDMTLEEAGAMVPFSVLMDDEEDEAPPPVPLPVPEARSGTSSDESNGSGNSGAGGVARVETRGVAGSL